MGQIGENEYLDYRGHQVAAFDHIKHEVSGVRPMTEGDYEVSAEKLRAAVEEEAVKYVIDHYPFGTSGVYTKDGHIIIAISSSKFNPNNFWNGRWRSVWTATFAGNTVNLHARIRVNVHYYEDGNVQLNTNTEKKLSVPAAGDEKATAANIIREIRKAEQTFHSALDGADVAMSETTFKALRRVLPVTRTKVNWEKIRNYRIGAEAVGSKN